MKFAGMLILGLTFEMGIVSIYMVTDGIIKEWLNTKTTPENIERLRQIYLLSYFIVAYVLIFFIKMTMGIRFVLDNAQLVLLETFIMAVRDRKLYFSIGVTVGFITLLPYFFKANIDGRIAVTFLVIIPLMLVSCYFTIRKNSLVRWLTFLIVGIVYWALRKLVWLGSQKIMLVLLLSYLVQASIVFWLFYLHEKNQQIIAKNEHDALFDEMTSTKNYRAFVRGLDQVVQVHAEAEDKTPLALIMADIDHFKLINDTYGHLIGNEVLKAVSGKLVESADELGITADVYRIGGEEFAILLREKNKGQAQAFIEKCRASLAQASASQEHEIYVTISVGYALLKPRETAIDFFQRIDTLLYQAKRNGRNMVVGGD
ncbi:GGDEF domain-containing protein [Ligilactobacillus acidipiscis]|uniref:GGDEF domain-containing protein n=1 Tax=Ligilactobacillus acidipiscis TaxID=89059 RepID=UPI0023F7E647|nr:GGDEF domain-containing protein [Ligilactobacillus acidipiscis]WEV56598.1 GGDEF domain-containing protein [Ligilactobacillus acidipiscis]